MFGRKGRKARRIAELERRVARLVGMNGELIYENAGLKSRNTMLHEQVRSLRARVPNPFQTVSAGTDAPVEPRPYVVWDPRTEPRPAPGTDRLTDTEAPVRPCEKCGQPHGVDQACAGEIREAA